MVSRHAALECVEALLNGTAQWQKSFFSFFSRKHRNSKLIDKGVNLIPYFVLGKVLGT